MNHTLLLLKPDAQERALTSVILQEFYTAGYAIKNQEYRFPDASFIRQHYQDHKGTVYFGSIVSYMTTGPILAAVVTHPDRKIDVIPGVRALVGAYNACDPGTIRGKYRIEGSPMWENLVHTSDSPRAADREIALWFPRGYED